MLNKRSLSFCSRLGQHYTPGSYQDSSISVTLPYKFVPDVCLKGSANPCPSVRDSMYNSSHQPRQVRHGHSNDLLYESPVTLDVSRAGWVTCWGPVSRDSTVLDVTAHRHLSEATSCPRGRAKYVLVLLQSPNEYRQVGQVCG